MRRKPRVKGKAEDDSIKKLLFNRKVHSRVLAISSFNRRQLRNHDEGG